MKSRGNAASRAAEAAPILAEADYNRLTDLADAAMDHAPEIASALLDEIDRAEVVPPEKLPRDAVAMHAFVEYRDETTGLTRQVQLVYPHEADIAEGKVSVLTQIGAALIGLREGQTGLCSTRDRRDRRIVVLRVSRDGPAG